MGSATGCLVRPFAVAEVVSHQKICAGKESFLTSHRMISTRKRKRSDRAHFVLTMPADSDEEYIDEDAAAATLLHLNKKPVNKKPVNRKPVNKKPVRSKPVRSPLQKPVARRKAKGKK